MRGLLLIALAILTPVTANASASLPPGNPKAPVRLLSFAPPPATIACGQGSARLVEAAALAPKAWQSWIPPVQPAGQPAYTPPPTLTSEVYAFSVDIDGRVTDLKRKQPTTPGEIAWSIEEQSATIASWRFAPGAPAKDCSIDLTPTSVAIAQASPAKLFEALADDPRAPNALVRKALVAAGDCQRRRPQTVTYPDLRPFDDKTVDPAWAGMLYDIDAGGAVRNVRVVAQHGETAFADAAASAVAEARFFPGPPRTGCYATFKSQPRATEAPKRPNGDTFERPGDDCKVTREALNIPENKFYPPAYGRRRVAGWALLRFDVAPWGQVGAIEVLASQPTGAFGDAARMLLQAARPTPPPSGYRGCVVPMIYAIPAMPEDDD